MHHTRRCNFQCFPLLIDVIFVLVRWCPSGFSNFKLLIFSLLINRYYVGKSMKSCNYPSPQWTSKLLIYYLFVRIVSFLFYSMSYRFLLSFIFCSQFAQWKSLQAGICVSLSFFKYFLASGKKISYRFILYFLCVRLELSCLRSSTSFKWRIIFRSQELCNGWAYG